MIAAVAIVDSKGRVHKQVSGIVRRMSDLKPAWMKIRDQFYDEESAIFDAEGAFGGRPKWHSLSPMYRRRKLRLVPGAKILHLTGAGFLGGFHEAGKGKKTARRKQYTAMRKSGLTRGSLRANLTTARDGSWRITASSLDIGSNIRVGKKRWFLARLHQEGTKKMPARPVFMVTRQQMDTWLDIIKEYFEEE